MNWVWWWAWRLSLKGKTCMLRWVYVSLNYLWSIFHRVQVDSPETTSWFLIKYSWIICTTVFLVYLNNKDTNICVSFHREGLSVDITSLAKEVFNILSAPPVPVPRSPEREKRKKSQFFLNSSNKKAKSVTLHIQGLDSTVSRPTTTGSL